MMRALAALALALPLAASAAAPFDCAPWSDLKVVYRVVSTADGLALLWPCQVNAKLVPHEVHATKEWMTPYNVIPTMATANTDPVGTFKRNAKTSYCFDPKGFWPTQQERNLCASIRAEWAAWGLK